MASRPPSTPPGWPAGGPPSGQFGSPPSNPYRTPPPPPIEPPPPGSGYGPPPGYYDPGQGQPPQYPPGYDPFGRPTTPPPTGVPERRVPTALVVAGVVLVVIVAIAGYFIGGSAMAQNRLDAASSAYATALSHQTSMKDHVNALSVNFTNTNASASAPVSSLTQYKAMAKQVVDQSTQVLNGLIDDELALKSADQGLSDFSWLTALHRSQLQAKSAQLERELAVLDQGITITQDYTQIGAFYESLFDTFIDVESITSAIKAHDINSATLAGEQLKADIDKAIALDSAPGLPAEVDAFLKKFKQLAVDFGNLVFHASLGDTASAQADANAVKADATALNSYDTGKYDQDVANYYLPKVEAFNQSVANLT